MSAVKFYVQGKTRNTNIYVRVSLGRGKLFRRKSGFTVNASNWSNKSGFPKAGGDNLIKLKRSLLDLESYLLRKIQEIELSDEVFSIETFEELIKDFHVVRLSVSDSLVGCFEGFIKRLPTRENASGRFVSLSTIKKYKSIQKKVEAFDVFSGKAHTIQEVDIDYRERFKAYLLSEDRLSSNTVGRYLKFVKTVVLDAKRRGFEVSDQIELFRGYTVKAHKVVLRFEHLEHIKKVALGSDKLMLTRDWLLIGCYVGQRAGDLFSMSKSSIVQDDGVDFIKVNQQKTGATVFIPIHPEVRRILSTYKGDFPSLFTDNLQSNCTLFNRYLKELGEEAGLNEVHQGAVFNPETGRREEGVYPLFMLLSSHVCRRSFATNFYGEKKYPTPLLMNITGHTTEKMFLEYIVDKSNSMSHELASLWR
ncbi:phage integrase SAM-like domain-containing protein [Owenweeksia hongkongensis]|uniref:site-specific integrase n=1 Tax=Owenweeksia hongkongensis TaxID=253245 RepID=UPI003A9552B6